MNEILEEIKKILEFYGTSENHNYTRPTFKQSYKSYTISPNVQRDKGLLARRGLELLDEYNKTAG